METMQLRITPKGFATVAATEVLARRRGVEPSDDAVWGEVLGVFDAQPGVVYAWQQWCSDYGHKIGSPEAAERIADMVEAANR